MDAGSIRVEVAYAGPEGQWIIAVELPAGSTLEAAIAASGIRALVQGIEITDRNVGVFSRSRGLNDELVDGDRVEIYRALLVDPKDARRRRASRRQEPGR